MDSVNADSGLPMVSLVLGSGCWLGIALVVTILVRQYYFPKQFGSSLADCFSGGHIDTGGSQLIVDGKIKLVNKSPIEGFTETGLKLEDGSELAADVVVFATGYAISYWASRHPYDLTAVDWAIPVLICSIYATTPSPSRLSRSGGLTPMARFGVFGEISG